MLLYLHTLRRYYAWYFKVYLAHLTPRKWVLHSGLPRQNWRHVGGRGRGVAYRNITSFKLHSTPTSKFYQCWRLAKPTCLVYAGENTATLIPYLLWLRHHFILFKPTLFGHLNKGFLGPKDPGLHTKSHRHPASKLGSSFELFLWYLKSRCGIQKCTCTLILLLFMNFHSMHISKAGGFYTGTWTTKDCIPVSDDYYSAVFSSMTLYVGTHARWLCIVYMYI